VARCDAAHDQPSVCDDLHRMGGSDNQSHIERTRRLLALLGDLLEAFAHAPGYAAAMDLPKFCARAAVTRQAESLDAACDAAARGHGFAVASLVRPAVEELVTLRYLLVLGPDDSTQFLSAKLQQDLASAFTAQRRFEGATPWGPEVTLPTEGALDTHAETATKELVQLGARHGWKIIGRGASRRCYGPSMPLMSDEVGERDLYDYIYAASSRLVHFSPTELLRRGWFDPPDGEVRLSSSNLDSWWSAFGLGWGDVLLARTCAAALELDALPDTQVPSPPEGLEDVVADAAASIPPLVTLSELNLSQPRRPPRP
jgi:hypothetical protein